MNITIYTKANCPNCVAAKLTLTSRQMAFTEIDVERNHESFKHLTEQYPEVRQMPQIFINGQRVGGLAGLQAALKQIGA